ncbi:MAG: glutaminyl-peptide cyclotransferase [Gloeobacteraceae cyanobacterium ES-bin-316]|nr:glutaminyl-peptide cyclotransferase [Ferruginibacter sp.]
MKYFLVFVLSLFILSCGESDDKVIDPDIVPQKTGIAAPINLTYNVMAQYPHDTSAYTQGLELHNGKMYEATGDFINSSLRITDYKTGKVEQKHMMGTEKIFGEGITILHNKIYQLTWQSNIVYVYDLGNIKKPIKTFTWPFEGWGITNNGTDLIVSDGSANLYIVNPEDFKVKTTISVQTNLGPLDSINELEYIGGFVYANVYTTNSIVKIDLESGHVVGLMDFKNLLKPSEFVEGRTAEFNGIAYDSATKTMFVTGKRWPKLFELRLN